MDTKEHEWFGANRFWSAALLSRLVIGTASTSES